MILQALVDYYDRRAASSDEARRLPPYGWIRRPVDYELTLDDAGHCIDMTFIGTEEKARRRGRPMLVPAIGKQALKHTNAGNDANLLWDGARFVFGANDRNLARQQSFLDTIEAWLPACDDPAVRALVRFVERAMSFVTLKNDLVVRLDFAADFDAREPILVFRLQGDTGLLHERTAVRHQYAAALGARDRDARHARCLILGTESAPVAENETVIKGIRDAQTSGANLVSFNAAAFLSYAGGQRQEDTAPISKMASFAYTTALSHLLGEGSPNRLQIADATTVIWADRDTGADAEFAALFGGDDPDAHVDAVRKRLEGVRAGTLGADDSGLHFFVLGLAPNASRIAVRFWLREPFERLAPRVLQHFDDLRIARAGHEPATPSMFRLLTAIAPQGKADNIPPRLAGEWMRAILEGTPYPPALLNAAVNRCRAEQSTKEHAGNVTHLRAAILKACINRAHRRRPGVPPEFQFIPEDLDVNQSDPAYRLGRLFAVLERIQSRAQPGINATIRDRYYGAASSTPGAVFPTLLRLKNAHLKKLADGEATHFERHIGEVLGSVEKPALHEFPRQLNLQAQGLFALGYYQQRQSFFPPKAGPDGRSADNPPTQEH